MAIKPDWRFPVYPVYKDSGVEWLGELPDHWSTTKIKYSTYVKGRVGWQNLRSDEFVYEGPYCVTGTDFKNGKVNWNRCYHVTEVRYEMDPFIQLKPGDLLITKDGSIGKLALVDDLPDLACLNSGVFVTRPVDDRYIPIFLYWVLSSRVFEFFIDYMSAGTTIQHLYQYIFQTFEFPLPSINEQRAIAAFLDRETAKIDALITKKQRLIELLQEKRTALISQAATKGLDPNVTMKDSRVEWLGEVPEQWNIWPLKRIGRIRYGLGQPPKEYHEGKPLIRATNIDSGHIINHGMMYIDPQDVPESRYAELREGEIIIVRSGAYTGDSSIIPAEYAGSIAGYDMILTVQKGFSYYYAWQILSPHVRDLQFGFQKLRAAQPHLNAEELKETLVVVPPYEEQNSISDYLHRETTKIKLLIIKNQDAIIKLKEYRAALISAAVTGKIDIRDYVPAE